MSKMRRLGLPFLVLVTACRSTEPVELDIPAEPFFVAVFGESDAASTAFVSWAPGQGLPVFVDASKPQWLVGYSPEQLETFRPTNDPLWTSRVLRRAIECDPRLPTPAWIARWDPDLQTWVSAPLTEAPELTHPALDEVCPEAPPRALDFDCEASHCAFEPVPVKGHRCLYQADVSSCGFLGQSLEIRVLQDGSSCLRTIRGDDPTTAQLCRTDPTVSGASSSHTCDLVGECGVHIYQGAAPEPPFTVERVALRGMAESYLPDSYRDDPGFQPDWLSDGYAYDFVQLDGRIVVSVTDDPGHACRLDPKQNEFRSGGFVQVDASSFTIAASSTAPPCLQRMVAHADGTSGFYATFANFGIRDFEIGDFDADGRLTRSRALEIPLREATEDAPSSSDRAPTALELYGDPPELGLLESYILVTRPVFGTSFRILGVSDFEPRDRIDYDTRQGTYLTPLPNNSMVVSFRQLVRFDFIDWIAGQIETSRDFEIDLWQYFGASYYHPWSGQFLLSGDTDLRAYDTRDWKALAQKPIFERLNTLVLIAAWPADDRIALVLSISDRAEPELRAFGSLFDTEAGRFLPGAWPIGYGAVNHAEVDAQGRVLLLLPWSGELLRLTPRPPQSGP